MAQQFTVLRISDIKTLQLLREYKKEECLWNTDLMDYPNRRKRRKAAESIAQKLDIDNFQGHHVLMKFKNLRNSYSQELKKIAANKEALAKGETTEVYKPRVFWFSVMDSFIRPHLRMPNSTQKIQKHGECKVEEQFNWNIDTAFQEEHGSEGTTESDDVSVDSPPPKKRKNSSSYGFNDEKIEHDDEPLEDKKCDPLSDDDKAQHEVKYREQLQWSMRTGLLTDNDHNHDYFGKYVASLLRRLPPQKALEVQPKIVTFIVSQINKKY